MSFKDSPVIFLTRKTWQYSKGNRRNVVLYMGLFLIANSINFFEPLLVGRLLNIIQEQGVNSESLPSLIGTISLFLAITVGFWMFHGPARVIELKNAFLVRANFKKYLLDGTMDLPTEWHTDHHSGDTIDKVEKATTALYEYAGDTFEVIDTIIRLLGSYIVLSYFNLHSSYIVAFMVVFTVILIFKFDKTLVKQYSELYKAENRIAAKIFDVISNISTVIILRIESLVSKSIYQKVMQPFRLYSKNTILSESKWLLVSVSSSVMIFLVLSSYLYFNVTAGTTIMIGTVYILYGYVQRVNGIFFRVAYLYNRIVRQRTAVYNVEEISSRFENRAERTAGNLNKQWSELQIKDLNFSYHTKEGEDLHLDNVKLGIKRNSHTALVGESGSGKTTLLKIIRELYKAKNVKVYLDGQKLKDGFSSISSDITLIPQDPEIFTTTILENITVGVEHKLSYVKKFTDMARFTEVAESLPKKFNSSIVERGVNLSGGEKQRLALARGLMAGDDKQIILLDEPTSSVDFANEWEIFQNIFAGFKDKTIIASVHRLHLLPLFDQIYYFKSGKIIAAGSFDELIKNSKPFITAWNKYDKNKNSSSN
ncbi:MAG: hypothetical protein CMI53_01345 [Parcubacteria group bacterium]|nr:hypothetical protein [Parcubacteria group bacterium]|tara:strand:- start:490 stop:2274 length:1785 start_codon:yes stop_codon:yes gene_type:complete